MYKAFDLFAFGDRGRDWSAEFKKLYDGRKAEAAKREEAMKARRVPDTRPSLPLNSYAGRYSDPFYGSIEIIAADGKLRAVFNKDLSADLDHWQFDTFRAVWNKTWWSDSQMTFRVSSVSGDIESVVIGSAVLRREQKTAQ